MSSRAYAFTSYKESEPEWDPETTKYLVYQLEQCPDTGRPHWQGFARFKKNYTIKQAQAILNIEDQHLTKPNGNDEQNIDYCTADETHPKWGHKKIILQGPKEFGKRTKQGERTDIAEALETACAHGLKRAAEDHGATMVKYHKGIEWVKKQRETQSQEMEALVWKPWQQRILDRLEQEPHKRKIYYIHDSVGGKGKSTLARYLCINKGALMCNTTKAADIAYAWNGHKIIIFDLPRANMETVNWGAVEAIKNGVMFSAKYESGMKIFAIPHVIIMANSKCPAGTFSDDRIKLIDLDIIAIQ